MAIDYTRSIGSVAGSGEDARRLAREDARQRENAAKVPKSIILTTEEIRTGEWNAEKVLMTTIGGQLRIITGSDLIAFRANKERVKERYTGGITPKGVIHFALPTRRARAREEIHMAVAVQGNTNTQGAVVRFITNAGPDCALPNARHHVTVFFRDFFPAKSMEANAKQAAKWLVKRPIKFDCECEDHRYRFRYIASIGEFNWGRKEDGYPKIRNPRLEGVACKHVVRVMQQIDNSSIVLNFLTKMLDKSRKNDASGKAAAQTTQKQAEKIAKRQLARPSKIAPPSMVDPKLKAEMTKAAKKVKPDGHKTRITKQVEKSPETIATEAIAALRNAGLTDVQIRAILDSQMGQQRKAG